MKPETKTKHLTVAILLPSGVSVGSFSVCVSEDVLSLFLVVAWPDLLTNLKHLHRKLTAGIGLDILACIIQN